MSDIETDESAAIIRAVCVATAREGAQNAGLSAAALDALEAMKPFHRYRLDKFPHPEGAQDLIRHGLAHDISSQYAGSIRGAALSTAGEILRGAIHGCEGTNRL